MKPFILLVVIILVSTSLKAQIPLNKRDQKRKAEFEAMILAEENYDKTIKAADKAFKAKDYPEARMKYAEAMQYDKTKEQWLQSKVNDLDILMAKNIARKVDSISVINTAMTPKIETKPSSEVAIQPRNDLPKPQAVDTGRIEKKPVVKEPVQVKPKPIEIVKPKPAPEPEKVVETFHEFPQGITEEDFDFPNHHVKRIVVKDGIYTIVYKFVTHQWGGKFYFKDDVSVSERIWNEEVNKYREKFADKQQ